ncbi:hypothetical protein SAMN06265348_113218 [Pedobacter westerhofensis]|uniref:Uncharacterized protein n=1 Tax=Pedobacter westerhofensis TaxID=425512 RepID=A0A521FLH0_9SPHI|nr:hypothetical protein SAMN06265348_113218 [Pedobacter westerhofensis]
MVFVRLKITVMDVLLIAIPVIVMPELNNTSLGVNTDG